MYVADILNRFNLCFASEGGNSQAISSVQTLAGKLRKMFDPMWKLCHGTTANFAARVKSTRRAVVS